MERTLIIYQEEDYQALKKEYENKGMHIVSLSEMTVLRNLFRRKIRKDYNYVIDLSSLMHATEQSSFNLFFLEQFLEYIDPEQRRNYISDCTDKETLYKYRYCFPKHYNYINLERAVKEREDKACHDDGIRKIIDFSEAEVEGLMQDFDRSLYGHQEFKEELCKKIDSFRLFNLIGEHKILSIFLMGTSGVGKTEVARTLHRSFGGKKPLVKINFGNYSSKDSLNSLIGSPRGYVGSEGGELFNKIDNSDTGIILIDEFEKADRKVFNYFLELLETGRATNSQGEEKNLNGYIIVFTSNIKPEEYESHFSPELRSRFNYVETFKLLSTEDKLEYINNRFSDIVYKYNHLTGTETELRKLPDNAVEELVAAIPVKEYDNIRELNLKINDSFLHYVKKTEGEK